MVDFSHYVEDGRLAFPNKAVIWMRHRGGTNAAPLPVAEDKMFYDLRATLADGNGEEWEMRPTQLSMRPSSQTVLDSISPWSFPAFPRRGKNLTFRIYARNGSDQWDTLAEFKARNPTPDTYPVWKPIALPVTRTNGNVEVSLIELTSGAKTIHWMPKDQRPFTMALFKVKQNGQLTEAWVPEWMDATDATGNEADFPIVDSGFTNGLAFYDAQGTSLSPSEVWRLRIKFRQEKDLAPNQLWTSPGLAVHGGVLLPTNLTTNFQTYSVRLECSGRNTIRVKLDPRPQGCRLRLVEIVDDQGAKVEHSSGGFGDSQFEAQWVIPPKAESIKVTISLPEIRVFEFLAQPVRQ